jgi:hypothetical protein
MTREGAVLELRRVVSSVPDGTVEEKVSRVCERIAANDHADEMKAVLIEVALGLILLDTTAEVVALRTLLEEASP